MKYKGEQYKYRRTIKREMDCSGIIYVAFDKENV